MTDTLTKAERSKRMALVRNKDTQPEIKVRRLIFNLGYRYRLHRRDLPGNPDLVFPSKSKVIFVHGCFWHRHKSAACRLARLPKSRLNFWLPKLEKNRLRDRANQTKLRKLGWQVFVVWECQLQDISKLRSKIVTFLEREKK